VGIRKINILPVLTYRIDLSDAGDYYLGGDFQRILEGLITDNLTQRTNNYPSHDFLPQQQRQPQTPWTSLKK
jgi:hypothetical protein